MTTLLCDQVSNILFLTQQKVHSSIDRWPSVFQRIFVVLERCSVSIIHTLMQSSLILMCFLLSVRTGISCWVFKEAWLRRSQGDFTLNSLLSPIQHELFGSVELDFVCLCITKWDILSSLACPLLIFQYKAYLHLMKDQHFLKCCFTFAHFGLNLFAYLI